MTQAAPAGWYPDPEDQTQQRYWDGAAWTLHTAPTSPTEDPTQDLAPSDSTAQPVVDAPVLQTWKTSVGFSVLAMILGLPLLMILSSLIAILPIVLFAMLTGLSDPQSFSPILALVGNALMLVYAVKIYPSYFSEKPRLRSSKLISFANFMFGGLIFGLLWNGNLTKKTKGMSYKVQAWLSGLMCLWLALGIVAALFAGGTSDATNTRSDLPSLSTAPTSTIEGIQPLERGAGAGIYTDADTGASFVVPDTWSEAEFLDEQSRGRRDAKFRVPEPGGTAFYSSDDQWSLIPEQNKKGASRESVDMNYFSDEDVRSLFVGQSSQSGATVQRVTLKGVEYFLIRVTEGDRYSVIALHVGNGYIYRFEYVDLGDSDDDALRAFYSMVGSTVYP